jgi:hypothetical protein
MDEYLKIIGEEGSNQNTIIRNYINHFIYNAKCPCHPEKPLEMNSLEQTNSIDDDYNSNNQGTPEISAPPERLKGGRYRTQKKKYRRKRKTRRSTKL